MSGGRDHPRLRGEYEEKGEEFDPSEGSPPLARGIRSESELLLRQPGITPACAGNTDSIIVEPQTLRDHPRLRGEYPHNLYILFPALWITPACAGNTPC